MSNVNWANNGHPFSVSVSPPKVIRQYFYEFRERKTWSNVLISWKAPFIIIYIENKHNVKNISVILWIIIDYYSVFNFNNTKEFLMITNIFPNLGPAVDIANTEQKKQIKKTRQIWLTNSRTQKNLNRDVFIFPMPTEGHWREEERRNCSIINTPKKVYVWIFSI